MGSPIRMFQFVSRVGNTYLSMWDQLNSRKFIVLAKISVLLKLVYQRIEKGSTYLLKDI